MILHGYWRSGASYRVRIALALKGVGYDLAAHDLRKGEQKTPDYLALNPQGMVPALQDGDRVLIQSPAILEWLEETHPAPPLLPSAPDDRAVVAQNAGQLGLNVLMHKPEPVRSRAGPSRRRWRWRRRRGCRPWAASD